MSSEQSPLDSFGAFEQPPPTDRETYTRTVIFQIPTLTAKKTGKINRAMKEYRLARESACEYFKNNDPDDFTINDQANLSGKIVNKDQINIPRLQVAYGIRIVNQNFRKNKRTSGASPPKANRADTLPLPRKYARIFFENGRYYIVLRTGRNRVTVPLRVSKDNYHSSRLPKQAEIPKKRSKRQRILGVPFKDIDHTEFPGRVQKLSTSTLQKTASRGFEAHLRFEIATHRERSFDAEEARYVVGVDRGRNQLVYACLFDQKEDHVLDWYNRSGDEVRHYMDEHSERIKEFKKEGVWERMGDVRKRRQRYKKQIDYELANSITDLALKAPGSVKIALEDLSDMWKLGQYNKESRRFNEWSYYRLHQYIIQKAKPHSIPVQEIDPFYTSQICSRCGEEESTFRKSVYFECSQCGYSQHADANAAVNIAKRAQ